MDGQGNARDDGMLGNQAGGARLWRTPREAVAVVVHRPHLRKTIAIAFTVGTILFCINQLDVVLRGEATATVWIKAAVTYLVPFCVSNAGILVGTRLKDQHTEA